MRIGALMTKPQLEIMRRLTPYGARVPRVLIGAWWQLNARRTSRIGLN